MPLGERARADLGLLLVTLIWGVTFPAVRGAMTSGASPLAFVGVRFTIAALLLWPLAHRGLRSAGREILGPALLLGGLLFVSYATQTIGMTMTTAANSGFITGTTVVMVPFLDALIRRARPSAWAVAGAFTALLGLYFLSGLDAGAELSAGDVWTLGCALAYAIYLVVLQPLLGKFSHWALLEAQLVVVAVASLALAPLTEEVRLEPSFEVLAALAFCAVFATLVSFLLQFRFQARSSPVRAALIFALEPVFAVGFAMALLGEEPGEDALLGGALVVGGVLLAELGPKLLRRA